MATKHIWMDIQTINFTRIIDEIKEWGDPWHLWLAVTKVYPVFLDPEVTDYDDGFIRPPSEFTKLCLVIDAVGFDVGLPKFTSDEEQLTIPIGA
jgi:hypothetical protein